MNCDVYKGGHNYTLLKIKHTTLVYTKIFFKKILGMCLKINNLYIIRFVLKSWIEWYNFYFKIIVLTRVIGEIISN
jgi:hypothetical protein